ncbi:hypothetical protein BT96DRAFT_695263 [Gymnopus androsaceus JB14]|uniref:Uncharacterized protein n=1 Tax=Gymnopus androsaceus JB14 TaxID=1447944 RepID=A0A6A4HNW3_9AGAR|nr:hypothetical protein BT96DRAFT_695263 [Gymnopus androsaceus JB14]
MVYQTLTRVAWTRRELNGTVQCLKLVLIHFAGPHTQSRLPERLPAANRRAYPMRFLHCTGRKTSNLLKTKRRRQRPHLEVYYSCSAQRNWICNPLTAIYNWIGCHNVSGTAGKRRWERGSIWKKSCSCSPQKRNYLDCCSSCYVSCSC